MTNNIQTVENTFKGFSFCVLFSSLKGLYKIIQKKKSIISYTYLYDNIVILLSRITTFE